LRSNPDQRTNGEPSRTGDRRTAGAVSKIVSGPLDRLRFMRSLRFRLAAGFLLFFTLMLTVIGLLFRELLGTTLYDQTAQALEEEWAATKGYLRFEHQRPVWYFDRFDPEESLIVNRMRRVYIVTDSKGNELEVSDIYRALGVDSAEHIREVLKANQPVVLIRKDEHGVPYLIRQGVIPDEHHHQYFLAIGRSMDFTDRTVGTFTWKYFAAMPLLIVLSGLLGWALAGRGLAPVNSLAQTAHRITSSNLGVQIPLRNAGDELDELIEAFNRMIKRLNDAFEQIRQFSTDVSHELRTPLTAIRGQLEVALFTAKTPEQYQDAMVNALQDVEQLSNIVRALLLLSQAESGQLVLQMGPINLAQVVEDMVEQYQIPAEAAKIELSAAVERGCTVRADKTQMERLVSNLVSNAVKYTPEGGKVHIGLRADTEAGLGRLVVEDTGIGIPAEKLPHIFDRFYRVRGSKAGPVQGLGLGLSFVAWIVNAHGGTIDVESEEGQGSKFTVSLPLAAGRTEAERGAPVAIAQS
jgi:heavy metal sensor kinase